MEDSLTECFLRRARADMLSETLADETIIIDLANGRYFRVRGLASMLWEAMTVPAALDALLALAPAAAGGVAAYLLDLERAGLIAADPPARARLAETAGACGPQAQEHDLTLETYDDMADLLLLDPVHEVGAEGWPARAAADG